jgi:hypothetical protein
MGVPHEILRVFNTILYKNEFQNPQIFQQTISLFPEHSTLAGVSIHDITKKPAKMYVLDLSDFDAC